jgi:hypothetical protein
MSESGKMWRDGNYRRETAVVYMYDKFLLN